MSEEEGETMLLALGKESWLVMDRLCVASQSLLRLEGVRQTVCLQSLERDGKQEGIEVSIALQSMCLLACTSVQCVTSLMSQMLKDAEHP